MITANYGTPIRLAAAGNLKIALSSGRLLGVLCSTSTACVLSLWDGPDNTGVPICSVVPLVAGQYLPIPCAFANGLFATTGGAGDVTFFVN